MMTWTAIVQTPAGSLEYTSLMGSHSSREMEKEIKPIFQADNKKLVALIKGNHEVYFAGDPPPH